MVENYISHDLKELNYNPRYEELWAPRLGPDNPNITEFHKASKNTLTGFVESANVNDFQFENQRKTFFSKGFAYDPSALSNNKIVVAEYFKDDKEQIGNNLKIEMKYKI